MWGSTFLLIKVAVPTVPAFTMAAARGLLAAALLWAVIRTVRRGADPDTMPWVPALVLGTLSGWLPNVLTAWALLRLDSSVAGMLSAASPIFVVVLAHVYLRSERLQPIQGVGVVVGLIGVALIMGVTPAAFLGEDLAGELVMIVVGVSYAAGTVYSRAIGPQDAPRLAMRQQLVAGMAGLVVALAVERPWTVRPDAVGIVAVVALAVWASAIPIWLYFRMIAHTRAVVASLVSYLTPAVAVVLGVFVLGEPLRAASLLGLLIVFAGVWITTSRSPVGTVRPQI